MSEKEMPIFEAKTQIDGREYDRLNFRILLRSWMIWVILLLAIGCVAVAVTRGTPIPLLFGVVFLGVYGVMLKKNIRKSYAADEINRGRVIRYTFYPSFFLAQDKKSRAETTYGELQRIEETGSDFYLVLKDGSFYPVNKKEITKENRRFLREKKKEDRAVKRFGRKENGQK